MYIYIYIYIFPKYVPYSFPCVFLTYGVNRSFWTSKTDSVVFLKQRGVFLEGFASREGPGPSPHGPMWAHMGPIWALLGLKGPCTDQPSVNLQPP